MECHGPNPRAGLRNLSPCSCLAAGRGIITASQGPFQPPEKKLRWGRVARKEEGGGKGETGPGIMTSPLQVLTGPVCPIVWFCGGGMVKGDGRNAS